jgi:hypothetical protein
LDVPPRANQAGRVLSCCSWDIFGDVIEPESPCVDVKKERTREGAFPEGNAATERSGCVVIRVLARLCMQRTRPKESRCAESPRDSPVILKADQCTLMRWICIADGPREKPVVVDLGGSVGLVRSRTRG